MRVAPRFLCIPDLSTSPLPTSPRQAGEAPGGVSQLGQELQLPSLKATLPPPVLAHWPQAAPQQGPWALTSAGRG